MNVFVELSVFVCVSIIIPILLGKFFDYLVVLVFTVLLRTRLGGIHFTSNKLCIIISALYINIPILLKPSDSVCYISIFGLINVLCLIILTLKYRAVIHKNHISTEYLINKNTKYALIVEIIYILLLTVFYVFNLFTLTYYLAYTIFIQTFSYSYCILIDKHKNIRNN